MLSKKRPIFHNLCNYSKCFLKIHSTHHKYIFYWIDIVVNELYVNKLRLSFCWKKYYTLYLNKLKIWRKSDKLCCLTIQTIFYNKEQYDKLSSNLTHNRFLNAMSYSPFQTKNNTVFLLPYSILFHLPQWFNTIRLFYMIIKSILCKLIFCLIFDFNKNVFSIFIYTKYFCSCLYNTFPVHSYGSPNVQKCLQGLFLLMLIYIFKNIFLKTRLVFISKIYMFIYVGLEIICMKIYCLSDVKW